ncbi:DNA primase [Paraburkholderia sp. Ac-20336]|uniref:LPD7 domain-containing protein n=1 Tax=Paraburkholderia sp. Ac-20336 TaxID=2703886 RepID=UPI00197F3816|nr:LPD7 domain-containing protein [Paraburkholderia sp. Ac-20336]MBN3804345.1 DNA primase [Paraburkholderia sp. Ac-20336]
MAQTTSAHETDPVINVIEQDVPGNSGGPAPSSNRQGVLDLAAMDAVSARRRREFDAARARLRDQAIRDDEATSRQADTRSPTGAPAEMDRGRAPIDRPPERVRKRYLRAGNQYFLKDAPYELAFEDLGPYLVTGHNRPDVVESMIDMVHAKSWRRIRVSGHEAFRSEAWLQGTLLGIEVSGYEPKAADLARLSDARQAQQSNRIEVAAEIGVTAAAGVQGRADDWGVASSMPQDNAGATLNGATPSVSVHKPAPEPPVQETNRHASNDETDTPRRYVGELREHGGAPYQHNPARSDSYYVVFRDEAGVDQVVWGVDLERAVSEANAQIGQQVTLENLGKRFVIVRVPILDDEGKVIGEEEKDVYRNTWQVEVAQQDRTASALPPQSASTAAGEDRSVDSHAEPAPMQELQRRRDARYPESERALHLAVLMAAMREQGFSERSVARVQQRAERMLVAFQSEGIPVPTPKVFDPNAPSGRDRRRHSAPERTPAREIDLTPAEPSSLSPSR